MHARTHAHHVPHSGKHSYTYTSTRTISHTFLCTQKHVDMHLSSVDTFSSVQSETNMSKLNALTLPPGYTREDLCIHTNIRFAQT